MLTSKYYDFWGSKYEATGINNTISTMPILNYKEYDWVAPEYEGEFVLSPFVSGIGDLGFSDKDDDIFVWYGDFSSLNANGNLIASDLHLQGGSNTIRLSENIVGLEIHGGDDEDRIYNARRAYGGDGDDLIYSEGIDLSDGIRPWSWFQAGAGDDTIILYDTTGAAHVVGGTGEDFVRCSMLTIEHIVFSEGDSLKEDGTLGEDTVYLFYRNIDIIRFTFNDKSVDFDDVVQTLQVDAYGDHYINAKIESMDVNINIYTDDTSTEFLLEEDFIFQ